jgi:hypothetical protein
MSTEQGLEGVSPRFQTPTKGSSGSQLGGDDIGLSPREAAAAAAEARAHQAAPHMERAAKAEIIGRLHEMYKRQGKEPPFALASFPLPRLKVLLKELSQ